MPFQSTDQPAMTPSSNAGARSLTFVHAFEVGERKLCAMLVWLCSKCDGVHILMNSKVLVVGTTFSLARLSQCCNIAASILQYCKAEGPRRHAGWAIPAQPTRRGPAPPGARRCNSGAPSHFAQNACMHAPAAHPRYALPHVPKKNRKKEQRARTGEKKTEQPISRCFVVPCRKD